MQHKNRLLLAMIPICFAVAHLRAQTPASSDAQFITNLNGIEQTVRPQSRAAQTSKWNPMNWFKDPIPTRDYSADHARSNLLSQWIVQDGNVLYFIDQGYVFKKNLNSGQTVYLKSSSEVSAILIYKSVLVALRSTGTIYVWSPNQEWVDIGNSAKRILATDTDLVALTDNDELWIYKGAPGDIRITWVPITMAVVTGEGIPSTIITMQPRLDGHLVAFFNSGIKDIKSINPTDSKDIRILSKSGSASNYSDLKIQER